MTKRLAGPIEYTLLNTDLRNLTSVHRINNLLNIIRTKLKMYNLVLLDNNNQQYLGDNLTSNIMTFSIAKKNSLHLSEQEEEVYKPLNYFLHIQWEKVDNNNFKVECSIS